MYLNHIPSFQEFLFDANGNIQPVGEPDLTAVDNDIFSGCFGGGPGKLPDTSGKFVLDTGMMVPNKSFVFTVVGQKDIRTGSAERRIWVNIPAAPVIQIE